MSVLKTVECPQLSSIKIDMEAYQHVTGWTWRNLVEDLVRCDVLAAINPD